MRTSDHKNDPGTTDNRITSLEQQLEEGASLLIDAEQEVGRLQALLEGETFEIELSRLRSALEKVKYCAGRHTVEAGPTVEDCGFSHIYEIAEQALEGEKIPPTS